MTTPAPLRPAIKPDLPPLSPCDRYSNGHTMHWIQWRLGWQAGPGEPRTVTNLADDGTITLADGSTLWHHEPERLRIALTANHNQAVLRAYGYLQVFGYCFSVSDKSSPCLLPRSIPGETMVQATLRCGGGIFSMQELRTATHGKRRGKA